MSSDLHELIRKDLERIPLPASNAWIQKRQRRPSRAWRAVVIALTTVSVLVASLVGGQLLRGLRDRIDSERAASGLVAGDDLVYVIDGDAATQAVQVVAMPAGQSVARHPGATYVGSEHEGAYMTISGDYAYLPVARATGNGPDEYETYLQQIDLRSGAALARVDLGTVTIDRSLQTELQGPPFAAATATSADGRTIWLVRDTGPRGQGTLLDRLDLQLLPTGARVVSGRVVSGRTRVPLDAGGQGAARSRLIAIGNDKLALLRDQYVGGNHVGTDWYVLNHELNVIQKYVSADRRLPDAGLCEATADPTNAGLVLVCSDPSGSSDGAVVFLDGQTFEITATLPMPREQGFVLGVTTSPDGRITVLTDRPLVARFNAREHTLIDARPVTQTRSWFEELLPAVAAAKELGGPPIAFSPDARYAYVGASSSRWWGTLATIDLANATVVTNTTAVGAVIAVGLSSGGERLYALTQDDQGRRQVLLLEPRTLAIAARSAPLDFDPHGIVAVRRKG
jgi:hypothetical protein